MIFKLIVNKDESYNTYDPTNVFHVDAFLSVEDSREILSAAKQFVIDNDVSALLYKGRELHFSVHKSDGGFVVMPTTKRTYSQEGLFDVIKEETGKAPEDWLLYKKDRELVGIRAVAFSAMLFFGKESYSGLSKKFPPYDHATIMHVRRKTLPSLLYSKHPQITSLVERIAFIYGSSEFIDFCKEFDYKMQRSFIPKEDVIIPNNPYCGVYKEPNKSGMKWRAKVYKDYKEIHLGMFDTPKQASEARRQYCLLNNISLRNNRVNN